MVASLPVLTFHALDEADRTDRSPSVISFSPGVFQRGMAKLYESGYQTLSLMEAVDCLRRGASFPDRSFVITFDDGYQTVYDEAFPVLQRYGMSATVFLTVGEKGTARPSGPLPPLNDHSMLSWHQIREMQQWGIAFGAHTLTHPDLVRLPLDRVKTEVHGSKAIIEDALGARVDCFAYPYGRYDHRVRDIVQQCFACACSDRLGLVTLKSDSYALERIDAYYFRPAFDLIATRPFLWYIRARSLARRIRRAVYWKPG